MKRLRRRLCMLVCLTMVASNYTNAFASELVPGEGHGFVDQKIGEMDGRAGSYTYIDLGTVTNDFSSSEVLSSVSAISSIITLNTILPLKIAKSMANGIFKAADKFVVGTVYFTVEEHTTQVLLDGEFAYYIIDTDVYTYSNASRTKQVTHDFYSGESLSPASVVPELI